MGLCYFLIFKVIMLKRNTKVEKVAGDSFSNIRVGASVIQVCHRHLDIRRAVIQAHDE